MATLPYELKHFFYRPTSKAKGPSINYIRIFTCYLDPLPPFLHVIRNQNV